jgi:uncharacterized protein Yka (UPF0111/DUF47 family)
METEFNLSDKIPKIKMDFITGMDSCMMLVSDVKEFIRLLKEKAINPNNRSKEYIDIFELERIIDNLAGDKLIGEKYT